MFITEWTAEVEAVYQEAKAIYRRGRKQMSLPRANRIVQEGVLPFNFGMSHEDWLRLWQTAPDLRPLVGGDPTTWTPEQIAEVNRIAEEENELYRRLMGLPDDEFEREMKRLSEEGR